ncbi:MAG: sulfotransferase, partial [Gallionella sp.]
RNDPCSCGSGKKYKNCCLGKVVGKARFQPSHTQPSPAPTPDDINLLGALINTGRYTELENCARSLLKPYPDSGIVWKLFGLSLQMQGKDALHAMQKTAELLSNDAEAHGNLAALLRARGQLERAVASGRRAVQIRPDFAGGHNNLGVILQDLGHLDEAAASYRRALEINPDFFEAYNNLGGVLKELGQLDEAAASYRRALEIKPDFAKAHSNLGVIMRELGQPDKELECYRLALESDPLCSEAMLGVGQLCMSSGQMAEAEGLFRKALEINPYDLEARLLLAQVSKVKIGDENLAALVGMDDAARRIATPMPCKKAIFLQFALGKCFDDIGEHDKAFPHFTEGCKLKRTTFKYDAKQTTQLFNNIMRIFSRETIARLRGGGDPSRLPIFVLGMPRSGTTLTEQIIASHPEVHGAGELTDLLDIAQRDVAGKAYPHNIAALDQAGLVVWGADYVAGLHSRAPDAKHITDKMPANFLAIGLIHTMLPNAKIIHVNRNPVDTCLSCFMQLFSKGQEQTYDLSELGRYYVDYARLMGHWRSVLPAGAFLDVQYEDIVADQEAQARRMIAFCGLDWDDACIDFHNNQRSIRTASLTQVRQPIYKSSVERWRPYEKFLGPLLDELGDLVPKRS